MDLDEIAQEQKQKTAGCYKNGTYNYRSIQPDNTYCLCNATQCPYYRTWQNKELCTTKEYKR